VSAAVRISRKGEVRVERGHPWVFRSDVERADGVEPGAVVRVLGPRGRSLGHAFYSSRSEIRLRMLTRDDDLPAGWLRERLARAVAWRETVAAGAEACRLVHGEGDGLPSLVVDRYADRLVIQTLSQATERLKS
jgi:23S rRNA (cytosine1962-C5)-methyltransferase